MQSNNAFKTCEPCGGQGFHRSGDFAERTFPRCTACKGIGQTYLEPVVEKFAKPTLQPA